MVSLLGVIISLGLQIAQSREYLHTLGPKVGILYILGALGLWFGVDSSYLGTGTPSGLEMKMKSAMACKEGTQDFLKQTAALANDVP